MVFCAILGTLVAKLKPERFRYDLGNKVVRVAILMQDGKPYVVRLVHHFRVNPERVQVIHNGHMHLVDKVEPVP